MRKKRQYLLPSLCFILFAFNRLIPIPPRFLRPHNWFLHNKQINDCPNPFICWWTPRLMTWPGHSHFEQCSSNHGYAHISVKCCLWFFGCLLGSAIAESCVVTTYKTLVELMNSDAFYCCSLGPSLWWWLTCPCPPPTCLVWDFPWFMIPSAWKAHYADICLPFFSSSFLVHLNVNVHHFTSTLNTRLCHFSLHSALLFPLVAALLWGL